MKYRDNAELVKGLRELADFLEVKGVQLPLEYAPEVSISEYFFSEESGREKMRTAAKVLGKAEKHFIGDYFELTRKFGHYVRIEFNVVRQAVCEKKVVGYEDIPEQVLPARRKEIVEWECVDPILAPSS